MRNLSRVAFWVDYDIVEADGNTTVLTKHAKYLVKTGDEVLVCNNGGAYVNARVVDVGPEETELVLDFSTLRWEIDEQA